MPEEIKLRQTALITGASGGIGLELARLFAADRIDVVLVARSAAKLERLAQELRQTHGISATAIPMDLARPDSPQQLFDATNTRGLRIGYLLNNAGFGIRQPFINTELKDILEMVQLNIRAVTHLTKLYVHEMLAAKQGKILNVASTAAYQPGPNMNVYYATKAYVLSFSEALSYELRNTGVTVTALCPGPTWTGFQERAGSKDMQLMKSKMMRAMDAAAVARQGYEAMMKGKRVIIPGFMNRVVAKAAMVGPRSFATAIAGGLNENKK